MPAPPITSWALPSRPAAVALLALDAVLLAAPLVLPWQSWFAFAYVPLLVTVVLGVVMSGWGRPAFATAGVAVLGVKAALWVALSLPSADADRVGLVLRAGMCVLGVVGGVWACAAVRGWLRFFRGRPAAE